MNSNILACMLLLLAGAPRVQAQIEQTGPFSWDNLPVVRQPVFKTDTFDISRFGAKHDGLTLNTKSINEAITVCSQQGGGVVLVPGGIWLTGPLVLRSNVNLHLQRDALVLFTTDFSQYALVEGVYEGKRSARNQSPVYGAHLENVAITGRGVIDGNGDAWRMVGRDRLTEAEWKKKVASGGLVSNDGNTWYPSEKTKLAHEAKRTGTLAPGQHLKDFENIKDYLRPNLLVLNDCKKVLLEGVTFQNSPAWNLHPLLCEDLTVRNVVVKNPDYAQNGDGIDVESCKNVLIEGSTFDVGDDAICIKSGKDEEGRKRGRPTENVIVRRNLVYKGHGSFVIGSEMSGGARNVFVYDCTFMGTDNGLRFKTARGRGGVVENIFVRNVYMKDIVRDAILFDMYYFTRPPGKNEKPAIPPVTEATPQFRNFQISNVVCIGAGRGIFVRGLPEMSVQDIVLRDLVLKTTAGAELIETANIRLDNVRLWSENTKPVVSIENGKNISLDGLVYTAHPELLLRVKGERSANINVVDTRFPDASGKVEFSDGADASMLKVKQGLR